MSQWLLMLVLTLHAVSAVFWAGTTWVLARVPGVGGDALMRAQLGAATVAILLGAILFAMAHGGGFGPMETALVVGAVSAILAAIAQAMNRRTNPARGNRIASPPLVIALIAMVTARYWT